MNLDPKKNFIFYPLYWGSIRCIPGEENKDLLRRAIIDYGITGEYDKSNPTVNAVMANIAESIDSPNIKRTMIKYKYKYDRECRPFVFYSAYRDCADSMPSEKDKDLLLKAIINYGIIREYDKSNPIVNAVMVNISKNIDSSESRYKKSQENGALGGRPKKVNYETLYREHAIYCKPIDKVASMYGVSKRTVQRAVAYERSLITPYEY